MSISKVNWIELEIVSDSISGRIADDRGGAPAEKCKKSGVSGRKRRDWADARELKTVVGGRIRTFWEYWAGLIVQSLHPIALFKFLYSQ
jgi:hypothetical protein